MNNTLYKITNLEQDIHQNNLLSVRANLENVIQFDPNLDNEELLYNIYEWSIDQEYSIYNEYEEFDADMFRDELYRWLENDKFVLELGQFIVDLGRECYLEIKNAS